MKKSTWLPCKRQSFSDLIKPADTVVPDIVGFQVVNGKATLSKARRVEEINPQRQPSYLELCRQYGYVWDSHYSMFDIFGIEARVNYYVNNFLEC